MSFNTFAHDSTWKLCQGDTDLFGESEKILVNLYEHRNGPGRETDLTFIFGEFLLSGSFDSTDSDLGKVKLVQDDASFVGVANVDYAKDTLELNGDLNLNEMTKLKATLKCQTLRD